MAAPRPDVKFYLDQLEHAALKVFADHDGVGIGELVESIMSGYLQKRIHDASVLAAALERAGVVQNGQGSAGESRK
jgi:tryptophanase